MRDLSGRANHVSSYTSPLPRAPYRVEGASMDKAIVSQQPEMFGSAEPWRRSIIRIIVCCYWGLQLVK